MYTRTRGAPRVPPRVLASGPKPCGAITLVSVSVLTNCDCKSFSFNYKQICREGITLSHTPFQSKVICCKAIINNTTLNAIVHCLKPANKIGTKTEGKRNSSN